MWIDSHCHLDLLDIEKPSDTLQGLYQAGCQALLIPSTQGEPSHTSTQLQKLSKKSNQQLVTPDIYTSFGYHPWEIQASPLAYFTTLNKCLNLLQQQLSNTDTVVAIGETGLDKSYAADHQNYLQQQQSFHAHCQLAEITQLPLLIHSIKSHADILHILKSFKGKISGVIHGFSGSTEQAKAFIALGFYIGVGGTITYPRANKTRETISKLPLDSILLETDSPSMPLYEQQGKKNLPGNIKIIANALAELQEYSSNTIIEQSNINFYSMIKCKPTKYSVSE